MPQLHCLHRMRRYANADFAELPYLAYEDFEDSSLGSVQILDGWQIAGRVITYAGGVGYEDFETSTLSGTTPPGPDYGWLATGRVTGLYFVTQPTSQVTVAGATINFSVVVAQGMTPYTYQWRKGGVNMVNGGVVSGATTATLTLTGVSSSDYASYDCVVADAQSISITSNAATLADIVTDWATRVVANGGAAPSVGTKTALTTFVSGCITDGFYEKIKLLNVFVPDSLTAALTPLISWSSMDTWTNHNFVAGDLSADGLVGNGSTKYLSTGFNPATSGLSKLSMFTYVSEIGATTTSVDLSCSDATHYFQMVAHYSDGKSYLYDNSNGFVLNPSPGAGFYIENRTSSTDHRCYFANSVSAFAQQGSTDTNAFSAYPSAGCMCFANNAAGTIQQYSNNRMSAAGIADSMTQTDCSNLYTRIQALRVSLGGGYVVMSGTDMATDWAARVVANGGAAPSGGTKTALATFWDGLITDGIAAKMISMNVFAPDSLTAAITPFKKGPGLDPWTNNNFVSGDLTVNGLVGNASNKYLNTGCPATALTGLDNLSAGLVVYAYTNPSIAATYTAGVHDSAPSNTALALALNLSGTSYGELWSFTGGANFASVASPGAGFFSTQRTSSTAMSLYFASSGSAHAAAASASGSQTNSICTGGQAIFAFGLNNVGSLYGPTSARLSFMAITKGLSSTEDANLYSRVQTLRTSLGGGYV
jgi:hypothetical protein